MVFFQSLSHLFNYQYLYERQTVQTVSLDFGDTLSVSPQATQSLKVSDPQLLNWDL